MNNRSSKIAILSGFLLVLILFSAVWWFSLANISENSKHVERIVLEQSEVRNVFTMRDAVLKRSLYLYRMIAVDDDFERDDNHMQYNSQASVFLNARDNLLPKLDKTEQRIWQEIKNDVSQGGKIQGKTINYILSEQLDEADKMLLTEVIPIQDSVLSGMTRMLDIQNKKIVDELELAKNKNTNFYIASIIMGGIALLTGLIAMFYVLRHNAKTEMLLIQQQELADRANQAKSTFLANVSHELRTPLTAIIGYSEMLFEDAVADGHKEYVPDLENISHAGKHLMGLINNVLDFSKIEAGKIELDIETFDILPTTQELIATLGSLATKSGNSVEVKCPKNIGSITTDKLKLKQILMNLLSNANKFTHNGQISLTVSSDKNSDGEWINFSVVDTGIGIEENIIEKMFDDFSQANPSTTRKYGGTGLGLAITRRFAEMMKGSINVMSVIGEGSTFTIRLPKDYTAATAKTPHEVPIMSPDHVKLQGNSL